MYTIAKVTKVGFKYLEFIDVTGATYFTYDLRNAMTWGSKVTPEQYISDLKLKSYKVVSLLPNIQL